MATEGHQRFFSILSDITEEEKVNSGSEPNMPADPTNYHTSSDETEEEDSDSNSDSDYICIQIGQFIPNTTEEKEHTSTATKIQRPVSSETEEEEDFSQHHTAGYGSQQYISGGSDGDVEITSSDESNTTGEVHRAISSGTEEEYISNSGQKNNMTRYEIEEEEDDEFFEVNSVLSMDVFCVAEDNVYVAVGKSKSSMDALAWTLTHYVNPFANIYLIHVFPEIRTIPSPLGNLPRHKVCPSIVQKHIEKEREKRSALLEKFLHACHDFKIKNRVDAVLIENNDVGKTILKLIPFLNITKLVLGTTKTKTPMFRKNGIAHQIYTKAPETCEVKLICNGKAEMNPTFATPSTSPSSSQRSQLSQLSLSQRSAAMFFARTRAQLSVCGDNSIERVSN